MTTRPECKRRERRFVTAAAIVALVGPGVMVMLADTDAGSVITAAQSGARYRYVLVLAPAAADPGALPRPGDDGPARTAPRDGHAALIRQTFGSAGPSSRPARSSSRASARWSPSSPASPASVSWSGIRDGHCPPARGAGSSSLVLLGQLPPGRARRHRRRRAGAALPRRALLAHPTRTRRGRLHDSPTLSTPATAS